MSKKIVAVDLFCGAGGLTHGLEQVGIDVKLGVDIDSACEYPYTHNNKAKFLLKSVSDVISTEISQNFSQNDEYKLLAGCAPCQTFSRYNPNACETDTRWNLVNEFYRLAKESDVNLITMENVPGLLKHEVFEEFIKNITALGFNVYYEIINSSDYGLPQNRKRLVLLGSKLGPIRLLSCEEYAAKRKDVWEAIGALPPICDGEIHSEDPLHQAAKLSDKNKKRILSSRPGGTWKEWDVSLVADCHAKHTGKTYSGVYARMEWNKPSPTMTTQFYGFGNGRFGHPEQNRAISLREGAIFQGFPLHYQFIKPNTQIKKSTIGRMIGNAVPVDLGKVIGKSIQRHIEDIANGKSEEK